MATVSDEGCARCGSLLLVHYDRLLFPRECPECDWPEGRSLNQLHIDKLGLSKDVDVEIQMLKEYAADNGYTIPEGYFAHDDR